MYSIQAAMYVFATMLCIIGAVSSKPASRPSGVAHGSYGTAAGQTWRYHQIHANIWVGVDPSKWDESLHVENDQPLEISMANVTKGDEYPGSPNSEERDLRASCTYVLACVRTTPYVASRIGTNIQEFSQAVIAKAGESKFLEALNKPFLANFGGITLYAILKDATGFGGSKTSQCSTKNSEYDAFTSMVQGAIQAKPDASCLQIDVTTPDGKVYSLSVASEPGACGAPNRSGV